MAVRESQDRQLGGYSKKFVTLEEAARRLNLPADDVEAMIRSGALQVFRIGGHLVRLRLEDVQAIPLLQEGGKVSPVSEHDRLAEFFYFKGFYVVAFLVVLTLIALILAL